MRGMELWGKNNRGLKIIAGLKIIDFHVSNFVILCYNQIVQVGQGCIGVNIQEDNLNATPYYKKFYYGCVKIAMEVACKEEVVYGKSY